MKIKLLSLSVLCGMMICNTYAQNTPSEVVNVEKSYTPQVKSQKKAPLAPSASVTEGEKLPVSYITETQNTQIASSTRPISMMLLPQEEVDNTYYPNYIKAGFGYNISTLGQAYYKTSLGKTTLWGKINHDRGQNSEDTRTDDKSVYAHTDASIGLSREIDSYMTGINFTFADNAFSNNTPTIDGQGSSILPYIEKFKNSSFSGQVFIKSLQEGKLFDRLVVEAGHFDGIENSAETYINAAARFNIKIRHWDISLDAKWDYYDEKYSAIDAPEAGDDMMLLSALPQISYKKGLFDARVGVRVEVVGGSMDGAEFHIMPEAHASIGMMNGTVNLYGDFTSGVKMNTLRELTQFNPYLSPYAEPIYTLERFKARLGVSTTISPALKIDANLSYGKVEDSPLWIFNHYTPQYIIDSDNINILTAQISGKYDINSLHTASAFVEYNNSSSDILSGASYIPELRIGASWTGKFHDEKIGVYARMAYNSASALAHITDNTIYEVENDSYIEYYGEVSYKLTRRWSVFVNINNMIDGRNPKFYGFEEIGLRALAGIKFNF